MLGNDVFVCLPTGSGVERAYAILFLPLAFNVFFEDIIIEH